MACSCSDDFLSEGEADASLAAAADRRVKVGAGMTSQLACSTATTKLPRKIAPKRHFPQEFRPDQEHSLPRDGSHCGDVVLAEKRPALINKSDMATEAVDANLQSGDTSGEDCSSGQDPAPN